MPHDTICRCEVEMKVWNRKHRHVFLTRGEVEVAHPGLHDQFLVVCIVEVLRFGGLEDFNGALDAGLELFKGCLVVFEHRKLLGAEALNGEFGGV